MPQRRVVTGRSHEPRARFAEELRLLRAGKGVSLRELAEELGWDASTLGKMESGRSLGSPEIVEALGQYYGTSELLLALWELAVADLTPFKERYRAYMQLEADAVSMWHYASANLPGVLQSPAYARELLAAGGLEGDELNAQVEARLGRAELLVEEDAPYFRTILSEAVLRTPLRDRGEWRAQLEHLLHMSERPNVTIQVMPFSSGPHALMNTDVWFLRGFDGRTVAWVETGYSGELIEKAREVDRLQLRYDLVRDSALSPDESRELIRQVWEEAQCEPST